MKNTFAVLITVLVLSMTACGENSNQVQVEKADQAAANDEMVEKIDYSSEKGAVKYIGFEKADPKLTDDDNDDALVFIFEYTNLQNEVKAFWNDFQLKFYQNGHEINEANSYTGYAEKQYELVSSSFDTALKGGKVTFGRIVLPEDDSLVTIVLSQNLIGNAEIYQMMEIDIATDAGTEEKDSASDEDTIKSALLGTWVHEESGGSFNFTDNGVTLNNGNNAMMKGTYSINLEDKLIECTFDATDGKVGIKMPFEYDNDSLTLKNNHNEELVKK